MPKLFWPFLALFLILASCGQDLHFKIHFDEIGGLTEGDPLVLNDQQVGKVVAIDAAEGGGQLVGVAIDRASVGAATVDSKFYLLDNPNDPTHQHIEIVQARPDGKPLAEGAIVEGSRPGPLGLLPFGTILKQFGDALRDLREQVERFRQEFEKLPRSEEAKKLEEEWRRLMDEMREAQSAAEGSLKKELLPKLQKQMEELKKKLQELEEGSRKKGKPLET
jgi:hypothetical protein